MAGREFRKAQQEAEEEAERERAAKAAATADAQRRHRRPRRDRSGRIRRCRPVAREESVTAAPGQSWTPCSGPARSRPGGMLAELGQLERPGSRP